MKGFSNPWNKNQIDFFTKIHTNLKTPAGADVSSVPYSPPVFHQYFIIQNMYFCPKIE